MARHIAPGESNFARAGLVPFGRSCVNLSLFFAAFVVSTPLHAASAPAFADTPLFSLDLGHIEVTWGRRGPAAVVATARLQGPSFKVVWTGGEPPPAPPKGQPPGPAMAVRLVSPLPVTIDRVSIEDGSVSYTDRTTSEQELLRAHGLAITVENFSTNRAASKGLPTLVTGRGRIGRDGNLALFITLTPWSDHLNFAGRVQIVGLQLDELKGFFKKSVGFVPTQGRLSVFMQFSVHNGQLSGAVRPVVTDAEVSQEALGASAELKTWAAQGAIDLLSRNVGGKQRLSIVLPLRGNIEKPQAGVWSAVAGVIESAFTGAIKTGYQNLSPLKR